MVTQPENKPNPNLTWLIFGKINQIGFTVGSRKFRCTMAIEQVFLGNITCTTVGAITCWANFWYTGCRFLCSRRGSSYRCRGSRYLWIGNCWWFTRSCCLRLLGGCRLSCYVLRCCLKPFDSTGGRKRNIVNRDKAISASTHNCFDNKLNISKIN